MTEIDGRATARSNLTPQPNQFEFLKRENTELKEQLLKLAKLLMEKIASSP
jgi:hypothetical protein